MSAAALLPAEPAAARPLIEADAVSRFYKIGLGAFRGSATLKAVNEVSLVLQAGKTLAIVGESGCGKSTLARVLAMIEPASGGRVIIDGVDVARASPSELKRLRREVQVVFQDPYGSLNPRQKIGSILEEPLKINRPDIPAAERRQAAIAMMERVGLRPEHYSRYPHMFSGGQRQRVAIARALMLKPRIVVLDEPVSALDLSVQAQVLNVLSALKDEFGLSYIFISHGLSVVRHMADDVMVMYLGRAVEVGPRDEIFAHPRHPYTRALLSATPVADPSRPRERLRLKGELPSPINPPAGCAFHPRCPLAFDRCRVERPELERKGGAEVACFAVDADGEVRRAEAAIAT
ncbi:MAG TPA: dipeptide ABC transporter ATP-binding protein [Bauldia sp.]|nr:dipeptide ABC transporter ATP-binding protein [Bauldia sp.]